jgi:hypothetical protein
MSHSVVQRIALSCMIALSCIVMSCIALHCVALRCIVTSCIALHFVALRCIVLLCIPLHFATSCCAALCRVAHRGIALCCIAVRFTLLRYCPIVLSCVASRCIAVRRVALRHKIVLHFPKVRSVALCLFAMRFVALQNHRLLSIALNHVALFRIAFASYCSLYRRMQELISNSTVSMKFIHAHLHSKVFTSNSSLRK